MNDETSSDDTDKGSAQTPASQDSIRSIDQDDLAALIAELEAHLASRRPTPTSSAADDDDAQLRAVCLTLIAGPSELGLDGGLSSHCDEARTVLDSARDDAPFEVRACRLWLACAAGGSGDAVRSLWTGLAREPLWPPVRALAFRALAFYGLRSVLADLLPREGPLSLTEADAWLDTGHLQDLDAGWIDRLTVESGGSWASLIRDRWATLLAAEAALWNPDGVDRDLAVLADVRQRNTAPLTFAEVELGRVAARAVAAIARARIARGEDDDEVLSSGVGRQLPIWEREYLRGLGRWQVSELDAAEAALHRALAANPYQTCVRCALAALIAPTSPDVALHILSEDTAASRESLIARASLLARVSRYDEAERTLASADAAGLDAIRVSWPRGRAQSQRRALSLHAALAERRLDWKAAEVAWLAASASRNKGVRESRRLFAAHRERTGLGAGKSWRRDILTQRLDRASRELGAVPLIGNALFFRAAAVLEAWPDRAARDFEALLRQSSWVEAERRVGGGRLMFVGDALLRLGHVDAAIRAYRRASETPSLGLLERVAVAGVYAEIVHRTGREVIANAAERAAENAPTSAWPQLLAAVGLLTVVDAERARAAVAAAESRSAPEPVLRLLRAVCDVLAGAATIVTDDDLAALRLPSESAAIVRFLCGSGTEAARVAALVTALGDQWMVHSPVDPAAMARRLAAALCRKGTSHAALEHADRLERSGQDWAIALAGHVRVVAALQRAARGELQEAERELARVEASLVPGPGREGVSE